MTGPIETYRVEAYNTAKFSENKMHDDKVAQRFGFSGGLVPGVDVMAYMMHVPVAQWGRAFLERGLMDVRLLKPVYDGELTDIKAYDNDGVIAIEVESRGELCASGTASLPAAAPTLSIADYPKIAPVAERKPVSVTSFEAGKWLGSTPRAWAREAADEYLVDVRERDPIYAREGLGHPGLLQRVMNKVLVDNAILGPWIHVGSRMQLLNAARSGDELTARAKVTTWTLLVPAARSAAAAAAPPRRPPRRRRCRRRSPAAPPGAPGHRTKGIGRSTMPLWSTPTRA